MLSLQVPPTLHDDIMDATTYRPQPKKDLPMSDRKYRFLVVAYLSAIVAGVALASYPVYLHGSTPAKLLLLAIVGPAVMALVGMILAVIFFRSSE